MRSTNIYQDDLLYNKGMKIVFRSYILLLQYLTKLFTIPQCNGCLPILREAWLHLFVTLFIHVIYLFLVSSWLSTIRRIFCFLLVCLFVCSFFFVVIPIKNQCLCGHYKQNKTYICTCLRDFRQAKGGSS